MLNDDKIYGWLPFVRNKDVWPLLDRFNEQLRAEAESLGDLYIEVDPGDFGSDDFADNGHFDEAGAAKFAHMIAPPVAEACRR